MCYTQQLDCRQWQFSHIPAFTQGKMSPLFASCGEGITRDGFSFMHTFFEVESHAAETYAEGLLMQGFSMVYQHHIGDNRFYQFAVNQSYFYISYLRNSKTARFLLEDCTISPKEIADSKQKQIHADTVFAQFSLHYDDMNRYTTCDCGMNYVYRLRDNSLILIDGGEEEQCTEAAFREYLDFLHQLTDTAEGEPITVALWICTHAHNDHCDFFSKLIRFCHGEIQLNAVAFNFPDENNTKHSDSVAKLRERLAAYYPTVKYCKLHGGMRFPVGNASVTVLTSLENSIGVKEEHPFPGLNDSSTVFTVEAEGITTLFLADMGELNAEIFMQNYAPFCRQVDFLQAAHHGINAIFNVYEAVDAKVLLLPQCDKNMVTRFPEQLAHYMARYGEDNILLAHNQTDIFTLKNGAFTHTSRPHVGEAYDGSEW